MLDVDVQTQSSARFTRCHSNPDTPSIGWKCGDPTVNSVPQDLVLVMQVCRSFMVGSGDIAELGHSLGGYDRKALWLRDALVFKHRKMLNGVDDERWIEVDEAERTWWGMANLLEQRTAFHAFPDLPWSACLILAFEVDLTYCMRVVDADRSNV
ncbi:hypothetical protein N7537_003242 [Penicillium hordei]|uniref:Uncharacterized protein n=1 Tax=Penicillium hordei TaxID=40994 RepID=A0AAD6MPH1_9EURO|nr:uncharacterized protein N7537_003242 [Penicillium hordei]KAJ5618128.1 hypothetical protein N7537_003242 [Penicillium hordei]